MAYAITIYKSQGITVEKDFVLGLSYMGVSQVKFLKGLMLEESFDLSRFRAKIGKIEEMRLADVELRRPQHLAP